MRRVPAHLALVKLLRFPATLALVPLLALPAAARGGGAESAVLVVDPASAESLYVANVYLARRDVPRECAIYMRPAAPSFAAFAAERVPGFLGALAHQGLRDRADYVIVPPGGPFYVPAPGLISDACSPVQRLSIGSAYGLAEIAAEIAQGMPSSSANHFAADSYEARWFDAEVPWLHGEPSAGGQRYRVGAMLGHTGSGGNTLAEVLALIDRSAAADATHPAGTFYYVETTDAARSAPRDPFYDDAVRAMAAAGGVAEHLHAVLPVGEHDGLGVMTGWATPDVLGADYTLLAGAFGDHLTSYAGAFDVAGQTKMSQWIAKGASGTAGTVEEPCNYAGKFPHARLHVLYRRGMLLGEAWLRSQGFVPFQPLLYGDPLTAPWALPPSVRVPDLPAGPVSGTLALAPLAAAAAPNASIARLEALVDGARVAQSTDGVLLLDTLALADGRHDLRVLAYDDSDARHVGRFVGALDVDNHGLSVAAAPAPAGGDLGTRFDVAVAASGGAVVEWRLLQGARVVAAAPGGATALSIHGQNVGAGPVRLVVEALFAGGGRARGAPIEFDVAYSGGGSAAPEAFGHTVRVQEDTPCLLALPASYPDDPALASYAIVTPPGQAEVISHDGGPSAVIRPLPGASGLDSLSFRVTTPGGTSAVATLVLAYEPAAPPPPADFFGLDALEPAQAPALSVGTAHTLAIHGRGLGPGTVVEVDGVPLSGLVSPYAFVSPSLITVDLPQVDHLGATTVAVRDGELYDEAALDLAPNDAPALQIGTGEPGLVFSAQGVDAILAGAPGSVHALVASVFPAPSDLPGVVHLDLGAGFAFAPVVGAFPIDARAGWTAVHLPVVNVPPGTTIYMQSVELTAAFPLIESNLQQFLVLF